MPWHVAKTDACPASEPWGVIKDADGSVVGCHATKQDALDQMAALYAEDEENEEEMASNILAVGRVPNDEWERRFGRFGEIERRGAVMGVSEIQTVIEEVRDSGAGGGAYTIRGHAAVFNEWSLDLGWFRERILPGAFDEVLADDPDVWHLWDHSTLHVLSRTRSKSLELGVEERGLRFWSRVAPTSYANDLRVLLERGDVNQSSFAFTIARGGDLWRIFEDANGDEIIERDIIKVSALYDVTTTAMGAYPQTDSEIVRAKILAYAPAAAAYDEAHPEDSEDETIEPVPDEPDPVVGELDERDARREASRRRNRSTARARHPLTT